MKYLLVIAVVLSMSACQESEMRAIYQNCLDISGETCSIIAVPDSTEAEIREILIKFHDKG